MLESDGVDALPMYFVPELAKKWRHTAWLDLSAVQTSVASVFGWQADATSEVRPAGGHGYGVPGRSAPKPGFCEHGRHSNRCQQCGGK